MAGIPGTFHAYYGGLRAGVGTCLLAALSAGGCVTDPPPPEQAVWEASVSGEIDFPDVSGSAAAVSTTSTRASIALGGLGPGQYSWAVFQGNCAESGEILGTPGDYPALNAPLTGEVTSDTTVGRRMASGGSYSAQVHTMEGVRVACGNFEPWQ